MHFSSFSNGCGFSPVLSAENGRWYNITRDSDNRCEFSKKYGDLADCVFVHIEDGKIILFASTYNQPEFRLHNERYKKITDWNRISGNLFPIELLQSDNNNILTKSSLVNIQSFKQNSDTYGFAYEGKIYLNPEIMNSEVPLHEYTHLCDNYCQKKIRNFGKKVNPFLKILTTGMK